MPTVTIGSTTYEVYADLEAADEYLGASISATAWRDEEDEDQKKRALVSATRTIDRQRWKGEKTDEYQLLEWPRSGIEGVDELTVPQAIIDACCELAAVLVAGEDPIPASPSAGGTKRLKAGSAEIEYFRGFGPTPIFSKPVLDLIGQWLAGSGGAIAGSESTGTDCKAPLKKGYDFSRGI